MFIIQYQQLQEAKWYDDPYFKQKETIEELKFHFKDKMSEVVFPNKAIRYRIIKRITKDMFIDKLK